MGQRGAQLTPVAELDDLRSLATASTPGDVLSVCLPFGEASEELAVETELEWRALREEARHAGAPPEWLSKIDPVVAGAHRLAAGVHVVVHGRGRLHAEGLDRPPERGSVSWEPVPALVPLLTDRQRRQPHVVALVDRRGADVVAYTGRDHVLVVGDDGVAQPASAEKVTTIHGATYPLRKVAAGGWSQRRFQQHAEETWRHDMAEVATEVAAQADRIGARVLALGGDERAVGLLIDHLPTALRPLVGRLPVTRAADGSAGRLDDEVDRLLDDWLHEEIQRTLASYREELGQRDRAVAGPVDTLTALRSSRVALLLVGSDAAAVAGADAGTDAREESQAPSGAALDDIPRSPETLTYGAGVDGTSRAWRGTTPDDIAPSLDELSDPERARLVPLVDGAVAAALATGADVRVVRGGLDGVRGLGALLRW